MSESVLFDAAPYQVGPAPHDRLSADRRRTVRQARDLAKGRHPLTGGPLHADAAPHDNREGLGLRCGTCRFRILSDHHNRTYAKCWWPNPDTGGTALRLTHGAATDVRVWWPACADYEAAS